MSQRPQQRDFGGEFVVALVALAVLVFAAVFGILLSLWSRGDNTSTAASATTAVIQLQETISVTQPETEPPTEAATETQAQRPSPTFTVTHEITEVIANLPDVTETESGNGDADSTARTPRSMATVTATATNVPATRTKSPTPRPVQPSVTPTPSPSDTLTDTPEIPTETATATLSRTPRPTLTSTDIPTETDTPTETATDTPSATATYTATATDTVSPTDTASPSANRSPTLTDAPTTVPTDDATVPPLPTMEAVRPCALPEGWVLYTARFGESFELLGTAVDTPVEALLNANCRTESTADLLAGDGVYLPEMPRSTRPPEREALIGCVNPNAAFFDGLEPGDVLEGVVSLEGSADAVNFWYAKIEIRSAESNQYQFLTRIRQPLEQAALAEIDTSDFEAGDYWLRLVVYNLRSQIPLTGVCVVPVTFPGSSAEADRP